MQNDFVTGTLGSTDAQKIVPNVIEKIKQAKKEHRYIWFTQDTHYNKNYFESLEGKSIPEHCIYNTTGYNLIPEITKILRGTSHTVKSKFTFGDLFLGEELRDCYVFDSNSIIEICGVCTDICVISNALIIRAALPNVRIIVDANCCAGTTPEQHKKALDIMRACQIEIINDN